MKSINKLLFGFLVCNIILITVAQQDESQKRSNVLSRRPAGRNNLFTKTTSTTQPPAPVNEDEYTDELDEINDPDLENVNEHDDTVAEVTSTSTTTTTTTEAPKHIGKIIRPYKSNDALLSALKRRQQNVKNTKKPIDKKPISNNDEETNESEQFSSPVPVPVPVKVEKPSRKRFGNNQRTFGQNTQKFEQEVVEEHEEIIEPSPQPTTFQRPGSAGRSRFGFNRQQQNSRK